MLAPLLAPFGRACFGGALGNTRPHKHKPCPAHCTLSASCLSHCFFPCAQQVQDRNGDLRFGTAGACVSFLFLCSLLFDFCRSHRPLLCGLEVICVSATPHTRPPLCQTPGPAPLRLCFFYYLCVRFAIFPCFLVPTRRTKDSGQVAGPPAQIE